VAECQQLIIWTGIAPMPRLATLVAGLSAVTCVCNKQHLVKDYWHLANAAIARVFPHLIKSGKACSAMPCHAMPCYAMLCHAMLCYAMLCYAMLCYAMPCCACANDQVQTTGRTAESLQYTCGSHKLSSILTLSFALSPVPACPACTSAGTTSAASCSKA